MNKVYFHPNHIQTASIITDAEGRVQARIRHLPYGEVDVQTTVDQKQSATQYAAFTGQEMDESTGLIYYNARFYDPSIGRFISPDSIIDGDGTAAIRFNRYAYVANNPINYSDPTGHNLVEFHFATQPHPKSYAVTQDRYDAYWNRPVVSPTGD